MAGVAELKAAAERLVHELEGLLDREKHVALLFEGHKADLTELVDAVEKVHSDAVAAVATPEAPAEPAPAPEVPAEPSA